MKVEWQRVVFFRYWEIIHSYGIRDGYGVKLPSVSFYSNFTSFTSTSTPFAHTPVQSRKLFRAASSATVPISPALGVGSLEPERRIRLLLLSMSSLTPQVPP